MTDMAREAVTVAGVPALLGYLGRPERAAEHGTVLLNQASREQMTAWFQRWLAGS